ncbi:hypothetical protein CAPTEDRAFT_104938, partial [Capitella teleta]
GVLAQESPEHNIHGDSYIMSNYVKFVEMAGALVVPIRVGESVKYYQDIFSKINGIIYPGGAVDLVTSEYAKSARILHKLSLEANDRGDYFPILGICLGFQLLTVLTLKENVMVNCSEEDIARSLDFTWNYRQGKLLQNLPAHLEEAMRSSPVTYNNHQYCFAVKSYDSLKKLNSFYRVLSTNVGRNGTHYVSTMEAYKYPIFGVQWHPEKNIFQWNVHSHIDHSEEAVEVTQYLANFFIAQARQNKHRFADLKTASNALINNVSPSFSGAPSFASNYFFNFTSNSIH